MRSGCADNIVLIGFMGAGKSTVGRLLAKLSGRYFLDADTLIEAAQGRAIASIFDEEGEAYFRELEQQSARWMAECVRGSIISTGGGMPTVVDRLHEIGTVVYLKLPFEAIMARIGPRERQQRPLWQNPEAARRLFKERERIYESQADFWIDATMPPQKVAEAILNRLGEPSPAPRPAV